MVRTASGGCKGGAEQVEGNDERAEDFHFRLVGTATGQLGCVACRSSAVIYPRGQSGSFASRHGCGFFS